MKNKFSIILSVLLLLIMYSCKKETDRCEGVQKEDILSNDVRTIGFYYGYHLDSFTEPIIQDNFIFFNAYSHAKGEAIFKVDFDTYEIKNIISGSLKGHVGFHDNYYYFYPNPIVNGKKYYIDLKTMERIHFVVDSEFSKPIGFLHNEIFDDDYIIFYNTKEKDSKNKVYEIFKFIPNTTTPELIGEFTVEKYEGEDTYIRYKRLWVSDTGDMMLTYFSEITGEKSFISTYNISTNRLLFRKTLSYDDNGANTLVEYYKAHFVKDKVILSASGGVILAYDIHNGELVWKHSLDIIFQDNLYIDEENSLVYAGSKEIVQIDLNTGKKEQIIDLHDTEIPRIELGSKYQLLMIPFQNSIACVTSDEESNTLELDTKNNLCNIDKVNLNGSVECMYNVKNSKKILLLEEKQIEIIDYDF